MNDWTDISDHDITEIVQVHENATINFKKREIVAAGDFDAWAAGLEEEIWNLAVKWQLTNLKPTLHSGQRGIALPCKYKGQSAFLKLSPDIKGTIREANALRKWANSEYVVDLFESQPGALLTKKVETDVRNQMTYSELESVARFLLSEPVISLPDWEYLLLDFRFQKYNQIVQENNFSDKSSRVLLKLAGSAKQAADKEKRLFFCHGEITRDHLILSEQGPKLIDPYGVNAPAAIDTTRLAVNFADFSQNGQEIKNTLAALSEATQTNFKTAFKMGRFYAFCRAVHFKQAKDEQAVQTLLEFIGIKNPF